MRPDRADRALIAAISGPEPRMLIARVPEPAPRAWRPNLQQLGSFIDAIRSEALFRYTILALNTWARPEAICDIDPARQVDREMGRLDLNPPGRPQTKKYRPIIPITDCLAGWLAVWPQAGQLVANARTVKPAEPEEAPGFKYWPVNSVRQAFEKTRARRRAGADALFPAPPHGEPGLQPPEGAGKTDRYLDGP